MKIDAGTPVFVPVTITIQSQEELQLFAAFFGEGAGCVGDAYGLPEDFMYDTYKELKDVLDARGIPYVRKLDVTTK